MEILLKDIVNYSHLMKSKPLDSLI